MLGRAARCPSCLVSLKIGSDGAIASPPAVPEVPAKRPEAVPLLESGPEPPLRIQALPTERACPLCGEPILPVARKCRHCGEFLETRPVLTGDSPPQPALLFYLLSFAIPLVGFFLGALYLSKPSPSCKEFGKVAVVCSASQLALGCFVSTLWAGVMLVVLNLRGAL